MVLVNAQDRQIELTGRTNLNNTMSITWRTPMVGDISHKISQELQKWERENKGTKGNTVKGRHFSGYSGMARRKKEAICSFRKPHMTYMF